MKSKKVTVIIPVHNAELYISRCIRSLLCQTFEQSDYEIIIVNDCCTDKTDEVISKYKDDLVCLYNNQKIGLPASLNKAIKQAKGQFIVRVDADDYVHEDFLKFLFMHLQLNKSLDAVACDYYLVNDIQQQLEYVDCDKLPIGCGIMFKYEHMIELGLYDEDFDMAEDEDFRIRFEKKYKITRVHLPLYRYRRHEKNISNNTNKQKEYLEKLEKKYA